MLARAAARLPNASAKLHTCGMFAWDDLKYFLAFARHGSTLAASKALGVNQSTVARRLTELEEHLGRKLIDRRVTGYRLTELGEGLRAYAERVDEAVAAFERHCAAWDSMLTGTVRVTCTSSLAERLRRSPLIDAFHARYPGLRVEMLHSDRFLDLAKREADIAIRGGSRGSDNNLVGCKIADQPWAVYASRNYIESHGRPARVEDLQRHFLIAFGGVIANHPAAQWLRSVAPDAAVGAHCDDIRALVLAVKSGAGLGPLPVPLARHESDLVLLFNDIPNLQVSFYLLVHRDMRHTPRTRAFFDFVVSERKSFRALVLGQSIPSADADEVIE
jgi:DNA-binding transcriptional LysR family regulator